MCKLRFNDQFVPVPIDTGDEYYPNGIFVFNITKMIDYIKSHASEIKLQKIRIEAYYRSNNDLNEEFVQQADLARPLILAEIRPGAYNIIDGYHRLEKARRVGIDELEAYFLSPYQHMAFITTQKAYEAYIQYWNSKLEDDSECNQSKSKKK
jgi:hypothetical protein